LSVTVGERDAAEHHPDVARAIEEIATEHWREDELRAV
jgi:hypothetical protein